MTLSVCIVEGRSYFVYGSEGSGTEGSSSVCDYVQKGIRNFCLETSDTVYQKKKKEKEKSEIREDRGRGERYQGG